MAPRLTGNELKTKNLRALSASLVNKKHYKDKKNTKNTKNTKKKNLN
jgi:hypothetical protein